MRSTLTVVATLMALTWGLPQTLTAQYPTMQGSGGAMGQPMAYGYWVPVVKSEYASKANYGTLTDQDKPPELPVIDRSPAMGCDCGACTSRGCDSRGCDGRCGAASCSDCAGSGFFDRAFVSFEHMSWYQSGTFIPALVTTSPAGTPQIAAGVLPAAQTLFGNGDVDEGRQNGGRLTVGFWLDDCHHRAVGWKLYGAEGGAVRYARGDNGGILARPFFNADPLVNGEDALLVGFPGLTTGNLDMRVTNDFFGSEVFARTMIDQGPLYRVDLIGGWQFNQIESEVAMTSNSIQPPLTFTFNDLFDVENEYNAATVGFYGELYHDIWTFSALTKLGIGNMHQQVAIRGNNAIANGGVVVTNGGLFAQQTNIGDYERDVLCFSPEVNLKASCALTQRLSISVGYTFLYWSRAAFAGDQIDRVVNGTQLVGGPLIGPARPGFNFVDTDFWVQTVDVGLSFNY